MSDWDVSGRAARQWDEGWSDLFSEDIPTVTPISTRDWIKTLLLVIAGLLAAGWLGKLLAVAA